MEDIISFLMGHIYWVIVICGVIYSLFGRSKAKNGNPKMPNFGGGNPRDIFNKPNSQDEDEERNPYAGEPARMQSSVTPVKTARIEQGEGYGSGEGEMSGTLERALQASSARSAKARVLAHERTAPQLSQPAVIKPNVEEIRKAIVWSEILGPPRSKRPYGK